MTGLVRVVVTAATEEEAWRLAAYQMLGPFRHRWWHDANDTLRRLAHGLRDDVKLPSARPW